MIRAESTKPLNTNALGVPNVDRSIASRNRPLVIASASMSTQIISAFNSIKYRRYILHDLKIYMRIERLEPATLGVSRPGM